MKPAQIHEHLVRYRALLHEQRLRQARSHPAAFAMYVFGWKLAPYHFRWYDLAANGPDRMVIKAPIERGKSSTFVQALPLWRLGNEPNRHIGIVCATDALARRRVRTLKDLIESAQTEKSRDKVGYRLREVFPKLKPGHRWNDDEFQVARTEIDPNSSVIGGGTGSGAFGGTRLHDLIFDDPESDPLRVMSEAERSNVSDWTWGQ